MNAKLILAAVAAICCVQGIAAAVRPMPLFEKEVTEIDLSNLDLDDVVEQLSLAVQQAAHDDEVYAVEAEGDKRLKAPRNILTCLASIGGLVKTGKSVWDLFEEYEGAKKTLKAAEAECEKLPALSAFFGDDDTKAACNEKAEKAYQKEFKKVQSQILPVVMKIGSSVWSLKACFSLL
ncbi:hypothetical protein ONE63_000860 [Megalurothrips usitatus]|uniref:Secreted protein n=1 Tax=Megalurothrips usitatus TaxID=439358 RepID=A0AAV7Y3J1_9NEOP|nr:hypothetical protein ONE63_000860 [Megalurothrips usitatus]